MRVGELRCVLRRGPFVLRRRQLVIDGLEGIRVGIVLDEIGWGGAVRGGWGGQRAPPGLFLLRAADDVHLALDDDCVQPAVVDELARARPLLWVEAEHGVQERANGVGGLDRKLVFVAENVLERPKSQLVDVAQLAWSIRGAISDGYTEETRGSGPTLSVEKSGTVLSRKGKTGWKFAHELDYLRDVIFVLAVSGARLRIKEVIPASEELEQLGARQLGARACWIARHLPHRPRSICQHSDPTARQAELPDTDIVASECHL